MKDVDLKMIPDSGLGLAGIGDAETVLASLANVFFQAESDGPKSARSAENPTLTLEAR